MAISVAYAEKRYVTEPTECRWLGLTDRINSLFQEGREAFGWYVSFEMDRTANEETHGHLAAQFFYRALGSFDAAKRLSELGYLCEVAVILRAALEQFAFCSKLSTTNITDEIDTIKPIQSLNYLKKFVPAAGQLYGMMSKYTHFEFDHHTHFFAYSSAKTQTLQRGPVLRAYATHLLLATMTAIARYVLVTAPTRFDPVPKSIQSLASFIEHADQYSEEICGILPRDAVLVNTDNLIHQIAAQTP